MELGTDIQHVSVNAEKRFSRSEVEGQGHMYTDL